MALLILALLQRIFLMSSLMLLLVGLIFFMVLIKLLPILGPISGKTVTLMRSVERRVVNGWRSHGVLHRGQIRRDEPAPSVVAAACDLCRVLGVVVIVVWRA